MPHEAERLLQQANLRVTAQRLAVLEAIEHEGKHQDSDFIVRETRKRLPNISRQAVFDNLNALVAAGLIRRIEPQGRPALYETRVGDNHHHLICRKCHATVDVDCIHGEAPCLTPNDDHAYIIDEAEVVFWGICPNCQQPEKNHVQR